MILPVTYYGNPVLRQKGARVESLTLEIKKLIADMLGKPVAGPEGCLSFPEIFADITRPETVEVSAMNEKGKMIQFQCGGLLARAVLHETDHLNGFLFIDRMDKKTKDDLRPELEYLQAETKAALQATAVKKK